MADSQKRIATQHTRPSPSHYRFDFCAALMTVAMHLAFIAGGLGIAKRAVLQTSSRVVAQNFALLTQIAAWIVMLTAIHLKHQHDGFQCPNASSKRRLPKLGFAHAKVSHANLTINALTTTKKTRRTKPLPCLSARCAPRKDPRTFIVAMTTAAAGK